MNKNPRGKQIGNYALAVLFVAIATFLGWILRYFFDVQAPFVTFYPSVILVSALCGVGPALLATVLEGFILAYLFFEPIGSLLVQKVGDVVALTVFCLSGIILAIVGHRLNVARTAKIRQEELQKAQGELENRVRERTAELNEAYAKLATETDERKKLEDKFRQAQKLEALGTLAGGIAHDFNNVLAGVIGFTEMVMEDINPDGPEYKRLELVLKGANRGRDLVRQILAFSRKALPDRHAVALNQPVEEGLKLLRPALPSTIEIVLQRLTDDDMVLADAAQMYQILMNLCTNAAHAMREKGGVLKISISETSLAEGDPAPVPVMGPGRYVVLEVRDTGCGMTPEILERAFDPFFTTKQQGEGTGLGLSVIHGIVKSHNGHVTVESEPGKGTAFHIYLPKITEQKRPEDGEPFIVTCGKERILFVDDEDMLVELNKQRLKRLGYDVVATTSSMDALDIFRKKPDTFDLVVTDYTMPNLTGMDLAAECLKVKATIPIILLTGRTETITREQAQDAGIKAFLIKPLARQELAQAIRRVLDQKTKE